MTRGDNIKINRKLGGAAGQQNGVGGVGVSQTTRKKTVIVEMEEEYSGSDDGRSPQNRDGANAETW